MPLRKISARQEAGWQPMAGARNVFTSITPGPPRGGVLLPVRSAGSTQHMRLSHERRPTDIRADLVAPPRSVQQPQIVDARKSGGDDGRGRAMDGPKAAPRQTTDPPRQITSRKDGPGCPPIPGQISGAFPAAARPCWSVAMLLKKTMAGGWPAGPCPLTPAAADRLRPPAFPARPGMGAMSGGAYPNRTVSLPCG